MRLIGKDYGYSSFFSIYPIFLFLVTVYVIIYKFIYVYRLEYYIMEKE